MKRTGLLNKWVGLSGLAVSGFIFAGLLLTPVIANAKIIERNLGAQVFPAIQQPALPNQEDEFDWAGVWDITLRFLGYSQEGTMTITRNADGSYTSTFSGQKLMLGVKDDRHDSPGYPKEMQKITSFSEGDTFIITIKEFHFGSTDWDSPPVNTQTGTTVVELHRTDSPDELLGEYHSKVTHFISGNEEKWFVVLQPQPFQVTGEITATRSGEEPADQAPQPATETLPTGSFDISMGCYDRVTSEENIGCSLTIFPDEELAGTPFSIIWQVDGVFAGENGGSITSDAVSIPPSSPGNHQVQVNVTSITTGETKSASTITEVVAAAEGAVIPPVVEETVAPPAGAGAVAPPASDDTANVLPGGNPVSPVGQAAAAVATTALLAAWLFLETQSAAQGGRGSQPSTSSSSNIANVVMQETNFLMPAEAGDWLAQNTADLLDSLDGSPAAAPQPPTPVKEDQAGPAPPSGGKPGSAYNGPVAGITTEVFSDRDAYLIMQALQLVPTEWLPTDHLFEVNREDLGNLLGAHSDSGGKPQRVPLPNGNEIIVSEVLGIAFEDLLHDDATDSSTIDFTSGFSIAVNVVKPGTGVPAPGAPGSAPGQTGQQDDARPQVQGPGEGPGDEAQTGEPPPGGPSSAGQDEANAPGGEPEQQTAGEETPGEPTDAQEAGEPLGEEAGTGDSSQTHTPEEDKAEIDRFFEGAGGSGSQGQEPGGSTSGGGGSQDIAGGTGGSDLQGQGPGGNAPGGYSSQDFEADAGSGEISLEEVDVGDLIDEGDLVDEEAADDQDANAGDPELNSRIDALMDELRAGLEGRPEPPDLSAGGEAGGSDAIIIDGDESKSPTGNL